ncbi:unnamed protein product [Mytilus coruscus]|uniref:Glucose-methanol-choline oxidoreductase N-terminal domain-containing protein n=1 Tax=Mytilus coruscus TaxID=42192 RepID=A0A6J8AUC6_MYTCO|nr:unnamed protein product [Mytilus coruscus]
MWIMLGFLSYWTVRGSAIQEKRETRIVSEQSLMDCSSKYCKQTGGSELYHDYIKVPLATPLLQKTDIDWSYYTIPQKASCKAMKEQVKSAYLKISAYHSTGGYLPITESKITSLSNVYQRAAEELGYKAVDQNGEDMIGFSYVQSNIFGGERFSTSTAYIRPIMNRSNLHISTNSLVTKILITNKTAIAIEMITNGQHMTLLARKEVILSASAVNSPQLLMLSGIGPREHLEEHKIEIQADLPAGEKMEDHLIFFMKYNTKEDLNVSVKSTQSWWNMLQYYLTRGVIRKTQELAKSKALRELVATLNRVDFPGICDEEEFDSDTYWECLIRHYSVTVYHPSCTCRMGDKDDQTAVVDSKLRVKGIANLRVADASVMRHVTSGNTNSPSIMIGEKAADLIRGKDTVMNFRKQIQHLKT